MRVCDVGLILRRFVTAQPLALEIKHYGNVINIRNSGRLGSVTAAETIEGSFNSATTTATTSNLPAVRPSQALTPPGFFGSLLQLVKTHFGPSK